MRQLGLAVRGGHPNGPRRPDIGDANQRVRTGFGHKKVYGCCRQYFEPRRDMASEWNHGRRAYARHDRRNGPLHCAPAHSLAGGGHYSGSFASGTDKNSYRASPHKPAVDGRGFTIKHLRASGTCTEPYRNTAI